MGQRYNPDTGEYEDFGMDEQPESFAPGEPYEPIPEQQQPDPVVAQQAPQPPQQAQNNGGGRDFGAEMKSKLGGLYTPGALEELRHRDYDPNWFDRIVAKEQLRGNNEPNSTYTPNGQGGYLMGPQGAPSRGVGGAYQNYLGGNQQGQGGPSELLSYLKDRQQQEDAQKKAMRELLMKQIDANSQPVSADDPQIHGLIAAQQLARQRAAERQRSQIAASLATNHLGSSGVSDTAMGAIEQQRGEGEAHDTASAMAGELQQRRGILQNLLGMAVQSGDTESAQTLQAQLHSIDSQLNDQHFNADLGFRKDSFQQDLGFRQNSFLDDLGYRLLALQLGANRDAGNAFL
jgi:hypothetical protein